MAKKSKFKLDEDQIMDFEDSQLVEAPKKSNINPKSLANLKPRAKGKTEKKYMQLDIMGYEDYLNRMSHYKKMTRTKYIQELIKKDFEEHIDEYESLKKLKGFDKK